MDRNIEIIVNTSELAAGTRGSSLGPGAVMAAARRQRNTFFGKLPMHPLPDLNHFLDHETQTPFALRIDGFAQVFANVSGKVADLLKDGRFPVVLSGDHGSAAGTIAGIRIAQPEKRLGVVWIDAHSDIHSPYTTPSGNIHGMPIAISLAEDNRERGRNIPEPLTVELWDQLKTAGGISPKVLPSDVVFVAVRDTEAEEDALMERLQIVNHTVETLRKVGIQDVVKAIEAQLADCDSIYVSFDVDSMDPEVTSRGTGTPVGNGITPEEAREILILLARNPKTVCIEMVEVNPCLDNKINTMAETAFSLLESTVEALNS